MLNKESVSKEKRLKSYLKAQIMLLNLSLYEKTGKDFKESRNLNN
jgi:hypothetical protein